MAESYDLLVIGAGPGGYVAAIRAAQLGLKVACVEKRGALGGACLNVGCIPSKALLDSSELFALAKHRFANHGIRVDGLALDLATMLERKNKVVKSLTDGVAFLFKKHKIAWIQGTAKIAAAGKVEVTLATGANEVLTGKHILLATGSEPASLAVMPFDGQRIVSSTEALCFEQVPKHLIVVGGGYIGLELGSVWARLGSKVTVLEFLPRILALGDGEIAGLLHRSLVKQGLELHVDTKVTSGAVKDDIVRIEAEHAGQKIEFTGDKALVAAGRRPVIASLGLEPLGITPDPKTGRIAVNAKFQTANPGIYAIGDIIDGPMLAHKAEDEGIAFAEALAGKCGHVNYDTIPSVIYTHPEVASVGRTEEQVKEQGIAYRVGKFPFLPNGRAKAMDETEGIVKAIVDAKSDRLLGVHIFGPKASELIAECVLAMEYHGSAEDVARTCHAHPTLSEAVREAMLAACGHPLHG